MSRASVRVRPATADDLDALAALVRSTSAGTGAFSGRPLRDDSPEHLTRRLGEIIDGGDRTILVATDDGPECTGGIVGMLAARRDEIGAIDLTPVMHLTHLLVSPGQRRRGVGRALLCAAVHLAEDAGVDNLVGSVASGSREGNRYLARLGFAPLVVHRIASIGVLRRSLGMTDVAGRVAVLRRARRVRAARAGFGTRAVGRA